MCRRPGSKGLTDEAWGRWVRAGLDRYPPVLGRQGALSIAGFGFTTTPTSLAICSASGSIGS